MTAAGKVERMVDYADDDARSSGEGEERARDEADTD